MGTHHESVSVEEFQWREVIAGTLFILKEYKKLISLLCFTSAPIDQMVLTGDFLFTYIHIFFNYEGDIMMILS